MKTITKRELIAEIETAAGPIAKLASLSKRTKDADGCCAQIRVLPGVFVGWVSNPNYCGGKQNGYGAGLYAFVRNCGLSVQSVRLA